MNIVYKTHLMRIAAFFRMMGGNADIFFPVCYNISAIENSGYAHITTAGNYPPSFPFLISSKKIAAIWCSDFSETNKRPYSKIKTRSFCSFMIMIIVVAFTCNHLAYASVAGPGSAWQFVRKITLSAATPLANFQVKVALTTGQYTNMNATGNDLRFYDINNNICNYWIETWNNAGTSTIWVNVVTNGTTALYMYYGMPAVHKPHGLLPGVAYRIGVKDNNGCISKC